MSIDTVSAVIKQVDGRFVMGPEPLRNSLRRFIVGMDIAYQRIRMKTIKSVVARFGGGLGRVSLALYLTGQPVP